MVGRAYASIAPVLQVLLRYWRGTEPDVNFHLGQGGKAGFMPVFKNWHSTAPVGKKKQCLYWTVGTGRRVGAVLA